ncbi:SNF1-related protein kinase catalytic subunit alpha KIN10 [Cocos nucifera]|uniref:non-specific serine/threonine protein kinase n=1 Tax=Cocos nucifera TaxID=13894 RepID=A0A8K0IAG5_COCNU|nr:SNF1-related protein kinase catalytic subunit alpha KIN10 [Cocos nucifera]
MDGAQIGRKFLPTYRIGSVLGVGSFANVKQADHLLTGQQVAIKILNRSQIKSMQMEEKDYNIISSLQSYPVWSTATETLIAHRDLKPENLLLDSKLSVKIADFGLSNVMCDGHLLKTCCGSPNYAAPEVLSRKHYAGPEVDVWSCGVILYALLCGRLPFDDENLSNLHKKITAGMYTFSFGLSASARDLISRMLVVDPMKRITIPEIRQHPWFTPHLPRYLKVPLLDTMQQAKRIDVDILQEVVKMGFDKDLLVKSLHNRQQNEATVSYYLLLDNRFRAAGGYLQAEFQETMACSKPLVYNIKCRWAPGYPALHTNHRTRNDAAIAEIDSIAWISSYPVKFEIQCNHLFKRCLDIWIHRPLVYNIKCRWAPGYPALRTNHRTRNEAAIAEIDNIAWISSYPVKFEIQVYKTEEEKYMVDLQTVQGPHLLFLYLCAAFLGQLIFQ